MADIVLAAAKHGSRLPLWIVVPFFLLALIVIFYRLRIGGPGPQVNWVPRRFRQRLNQSYAKHGWQLPYDEQGERNPDRSAL